MVAALKNGTFFTQVNPIFSLVQRIPSSSAEGYVSRRDKPRYLFEKDPGTLISIGYPNVFVLRGIQFVRIPRRKDWFKH